jgi:hypothetical protein
MIFTAALEALLRQGAGHTTLRERHCRLESYGEAENSRLRCVAHHTPRHSLREENMTLTSAVAKKELSATKEQP